MKKKKRHTIDNYKLIPSPPKYMCTDCFNIFGKRYDGEGYTQRCVCGGDKLVRLDREVPIPRKKAGNNKWQEFFKGNYLSRYYKRFKESRNK